MSKTLNDDAKFDRLVDGELTADEYRALVASLDDEPSGWRRCALAFLESQALAGEMTSVRRGMTLSDDEHDAAAADLNGQALQSPRNSRSFRIGTILAMAASFLVAFGLGIAMPRLFPGRPPQHDLAGSSGGPAVTNVVANTSRDLDETNQVRHATFKPIGNVQLVVDGPEGVSTPVGDVPIYEASGPVNSWLADERPALSPQVLQVLERSGHKIERQIEYVTVQLDDGRQVIVPVERYQIRLPDRLPY